MDSIQVDTPEEAVKIIIEQYNKSPALTYNLIIPFIKESYITVLATDDTLNFKAGIRDLLVIPMDASFGLNPVKGKLEVYISPPLSFGTVDSDKITGPSEYLDAFQFKTELGLFLIKTLNLLLESGHSETMTKTTMENI